MGFLDRALGSIGSSVGSLSAPPDLAPFAAERGLTVSGSGDVAGIFTGLTDLSKAANVMYGELPASWARSGT